MDTSNAILVTVDFSENARDALRFAGEMAQCKTKRLVVLHVVNGSVADAGGYRTPTFPHPALSMQDIARDQLKELLDEVAERNPDLRETFRDVQTVLVGGLPANRILEVAERESAEMIVVGSHGRHGLARATMGSVAEAVARKSRVPVTIVKNGNGAQEEHSMPEMRAAN